MLIRRLMPLLAFLLCGLWFLADTSLIPRDNFGYNVLIAILLVEAAIFFFALVCVALSVQRLLPWVFTGSLLSIAPLHLWGAGINSPLCDLLFLPPFAAVFITGAWTLLTAHIDFARR